MVLAAGGRAVPYPCRTSTPLCAAGPSAAARGLLESASIRVEANRDDAERLVLVLPGSDAPVMPTHWSFGQLAGLVGEPAA